MRSWVLEQLLAWAPKGRRPHLQLIVDLTTLEKTGKFQQLPGLVRWYNRKRGLHLVVLYLVVGRWRLPSLFPHLPGQCNSGSTGKCDCSQACPPASGSDTRGWCWQMQVLAVGSFFREYDGSSCMPLLVSAADDAWPMVDSSNSCIKLGSRFDCGASRCP